MPVECHDDNTPLTFYDTFLFSLLILLVHVNKFNVHDTLITLHIVLIGWEVLLRIECRWGPPYHALGHPCLAAGTRRIH